jgi:hypothetical protein
MCDTAGPKGLITIELAAVAYRLYTPVQSCSRRSWVAPLVSAPNQPASLHRPAPSPTACRQRLARLFSRANADSRQARLHARPTVTRTALASLPLQLSPTYPPLVPQSRARLPVRSPTRPVAISRPPKTRLLPTCPACPLPSTSSLKVCSRQGTGDWKKPLTTSFRYHPVLFLQSPPSTQPGHRHPTQCRHSCFQQHLRAQVQATKDQPGRHLHPFQRHRRHREQTKRLGPELGHHSRVGFRIRRQTPGRRATLKIARGLGRTVEAFHCSSATRSRQRRAPTAQGSRYTRTYCQPETLQDDNHRHGEQALRRRHLLHRLGLTPGTRCHQGRPIIYLDHPLQGPPATPRSELHREAAGAAQKRHLHPGRREQQG